MNRIDEFAAAYGQDILDAFTDSLWNNREPMPVPGGLLTIEEFDQTDAINCMGLFRFPYGEDDIFVRFDDGNNDGTVIHEFGPDVAYQKPVQTLKRFVVDERLIGLSLEKARMQYNRDRREIEEKERAMNYDLMVSPTLVIRDHYERWAACRGLTIQTEEVPGA